MAALTSKQTDAIKATNKYGVVYGLHPATAASLITRGLMDIHTNYYGQTHGFKLTPEGFNYKRKIN